MNDFSGRAIGPKPVAAMMRHLAARQAVIADNIANADTPGFKARDITRPDFGALVGQSAPPRPSADKDAFETRPDGNNVSIEQQLLKLGDVRAEFGLMTQIYRKQMALMRSAIGR